MSTSSTKALLAIAAILLSACAGPQSPTPASGPLATEPPPAPVMPRPSRAIERSGEVLDLAPERPSQEAPPAPAAPVDAAVRRDFEAALALLREGRHEPAIEAFKALHQRRPRLSGPLVNLAIAYAENGQTGPALATLRRALQQRETAPAWNQLGLLLRRDGQFAPARQAYTQALALDPDYAFARLNLGVLCDLYLADYECALTQYRAYLETQPADAEQVELWIFDLQQRLDSTRRNQ